MSFFITLPCFVPCQFPQPTKQRAVKYLSLYLQGSSPY
nr:MAG TPA: hypothetical protein [Bacteriophage sp.]